MCERPEKRRYLSRKHAKQVIRQIRGCRDRNGMSPYLCECGFWHVGHLSARGKRYSRQSA